MTFRNLAFFLLLLLIPTRALGAGRGAFYRPGDWLGQVVAWAKKAGGSGS